MAKDLFKWTPMTEDLRPSRKAANSFKKAQSRQDIEAWMSKADKNINHSNVDQFALDHSADENINIPETNEDDIDIWLKKVRKAADVAESDVVNDFATENDVCHPSGEIADGEVSSMFAQIISNYIPNYSGKENIEHEKEHISESAAPLDDRYDAVTEAKSILNTWLERKSEINKEELLFHDEISPKFGEMDDKTDVLPAELDMCEENEVTAVLQHLRSTPVEQKVIKSLKAAKKAKNPVLSMAARQEQAKKRRQKMEEERLQKLKEAAERKAARAAAEHLLQQERARKEREEKLEEEKIQAEMVALRKKIREEQEEKLVMYEKRKEEQTELHKAELAAEYRQVVMRNAEEEVRRKRVLATRHALLEQLQEAEGKEMRERYSLLQRTFTKWREATLDGRVSYNKAAAFYEWKNQLRVWRRWRSYCQQKREKREEKVREALFRENKNLRLADTHFQKSHLRYYFKYWQCWSREQALEKRDLEQDRRRKRLMEQCLAAAVEVSRKTTVAQEELTSAPKDQATEPCYNSSKYTKRKKLGVNFAARGVGSEKTEKEVSDCGGGGGEVEREEVMGVTVEADCKDLLQKSGGNKSDKKSTESATTTTTRKPDIVHNPWDSPVRPASSSSYHRVSRVDKPKENKVPAALRGMEERARQRAERRQEIENRKELKRREAERLRIEEEKRRAELVEQKRLEEKERRLKEIADAREKERVRLDEIQAMKDKTLKAINHYHDKLRVKYVLKPLKTFCQKLKAEEERANEHYEKTCLASHWRAWKQHLEIKILEKDEKAIQFCRNLVLRQALRSWKRALTLQESYTRISERHHSRSLRARVLRSWQHGAKQSRERREELEVRAVELDRKFTLRSHLVHWQRLTPLLIREREAEVRRNRMRSMVTELLPDFAPPDPS